MESDENIRVVDRRGYIPEVRNKKLSYSIFHVLVNPVRPLDKVKDYQKYEDHAKRLDALARFLLRDNIIKSYLKFFDPEGEDGEPIEMTRQWHLDHIEKIIDKEGAVEDSSEIYKRVHIHLVFTIVHSTYLQVDRESVENLSRLFFEDVMGPNAGIYVHIRATNGANFFMDYIRKNKAFVDPMIYTGDGGREEPTPAPRKKKKKKLVLSKRE